MFIVASEVNAIRLHNKKSFQKFVTFFIHNFNISFGQFLKHMQKQLFL